MPVFRPRTQVEILRDMVARAVARSPLSGLLRNAVVTHILSSAAVEDAEQYFQMARLRDVFGIDTATGSDLDERAAEVLPGTITRITSVTATGVAVFSRQSTVGTVAIPIGTVIAGSDAKGTIKYVTTTAGSITAGNTTSANVGISAVEPGTRYNVSGGAINRIITTIPGINAVTNPAALDNGFDRESDRSFRARIKNFVQAISRGTPTALETFAREVRLVSGEKVLFAKTDEPLIPNGTVDLYIDDGTGFIESKNEDLIGNPETILASAAGGEQVLQTLNRPIVDDNALVVYLNAAPLTEGVDYVVNYPKGLIELTVAATVARCLATSTAHRRQMAGGVSEGW